MAILLTKAGRVELARSFHRDIQNNFDYYHFALSKTTEWDDEESPDTPLDSEKYLKDFKNNIMFTQTVSSADICHLVRRIDWDPSEEGTTYDPYDDDYSADSPAPSGATSLADANFYVITDELKVYKCIDNNSNAKSTVKPTSTSTNIFILADGYTWKFLFQVSAADETKFLDAEHIPVRKLTGNPKFDVNGKIDSIEVTNGGSGYDPLNPPTVNILGDGRVKDNNGNPIPLASATAVVTGDEVTSIVVDEPGSGYSFANIVFSGEDGGSGATASVTLGIVDPNPSAQTDVEGAAIPGTIDRIIVKDVGQDYTDGDVTVTITGDGSGAEATVTISAGTGAITAVNITDVGTGYTYANITFSQASGIGTGATARAVLSPIDGHGNNPVKELFGATVGIVTSLADNANEDLILNNDFRQLGLVKNFYNYAKTVIWTQNSASALFIIDVDSVASYEEDDIITTDDGGEFRVIQSTDDSSGTFQVHLQAITPLITASSTLSNTTQGISGLSINSVTEPEISTSTGDVVYIENRPAISRSPDQVETIKALVNF